MCVCVCVLVCVCVYIYIYIYIFSKLKTWHSFRLSLVIITLLC